ncbi:MAG: Sua5/YciO/YrdC/YwlC family protein [Methylotetracoccus sp.]
MIPSRFRLTLAAAHLRRGGVLAYPTEAVFGLGCDPFSASSVANLLALKQRSDAKGFIVIAGSIDQIADLVRIPSQDAEARLLRDWPGPVTYILPAARDVPDWLTGGRSTLAVRVTAHPVVAALCGAYGGPLISTSANLSGQPPARTRAAVRRRFGDAVQLLPGELGGTARPTPIYDAATGTLLRR